MQSVKILEKEYLQIFILVGSTFDVSSDKLKYTETLMAGTVMACLPWLFRTMIILNSLENFSHNCRY